MALAVPMVFVSSFQSEEDYYSRPYFASFLRLLRFIAYVISTLSPAIYVALTVYHQELIPTQLLISVAAGRELVPFPAVLEAFIMLFTFDILREAGVRLPKPVGSAVSIVGALVLGQSAVQAGLISPIMVIVVASTAIASFVVPAQTDSNSILRYFYLFLAGLAGGFGILMGILIILLHLASLRSFGTPYLAPIAPLVLSDLKDSFIRLPLWMMTKRPKTVKPQDFERQNKGLMPSPNKRKGGSSKKAGEPNE
jgi:spore germination protein KA